MTKRERLQGTLGFLSILLLLGILFTLTFLLTEQLYNLLNWRPSLLIIQVTNSLGGLFFFGLLVAIFTRIFRERIITGQLKFYGPVIDALDKIAKGDFSVNIQNGFAKTRQEHQIMDELVNSVNKMAVELSQLENMRQEFISNVSHEIQSPLTSIRGFSQALQTDNLSSDDKIHYLKIIEAESLRLSKLSDSLLKLAALDTEQVKLETKSYRIDRQIRNLLVACEPQWLGKALDLDICLEEITIIADEAMLSQVWLNLIYNSIKFTNRGGKISLNLKAHNDRVEFKINDNGIGISEEDQPRIFERFYKADKARTSLSGGSGLGLAITKKIIELHQGTIEFTSQASVGTTFTVFLPLTALQAA